MCRDLRTFSAIFLGAKMVRSQSFWHFASMARSKLEIEAWNGLSIYFNVYILLSFWSGQSPPFYSLTIVRSIFYSLIAWLPQNLRYPSLASLIDINLQICPISSNQPNSIFCLVVSTLNIKRIATAI